MKIYTKNGDAGYTSTIGGLKVKKSDDLMELQGTIDEINAGIGYLRSILSNRQKDLDGPLAKVQNTLFRMGTDVSSLFTRNLVQASDIHQLEEAIDAMMVEVGEQAYFIYYSGTPAATYAQVVRSVIRRGERVFVRSYQGENYPEDGRYLNRLADYMYTVARYLNHLENCPDEKMSID